MDKQTILSKYEKGVSDHGLFVAEGDDFDTHVNQLARAIAEEEGIETPGEDSLLDEEQFSEFYKLEDMVSEVLHEWLNADADNYQPITTKIMGHGYTKTDIELLGEFLIDCRDDYLDSVKDNRAEAIRDGDTDGWSLENLEYVGEMLAILTDEMAKELREIER